MKRLTCGLFASLLVALTHMASPAAGQDTARDPGEAFNIYMVVWRGETDVERGFQTFFRERGIPAEITILDLARDRSRIPAVLSEIRAAKPDLVHTWGTSTGLGIFGPREGAEPGQFLDDIPGMFSLVAYPIEAGLVESLEDPGRALTGTAYLPPLQSQLDAIFAYRPWTRFGMIYNPLERNSLINLEQMRTASRERGFELLEAEVPLDSEGKPDPTVLPNLVQELALKGMDFLYIGPDSFISINSETVTREAISHGIPSFAGTEFGFQSSRSLLGLVSRYFLVGKLAGLQAERILVEGQPLAEIPVSSLSRFTLLLRMPVAQELGLYPPMNLLPLAEIVE